MKGEGVKKKNKITEGCPGFASLFAARQVWLASGVPANHQPMAPPARVLVATVSRRDHYWGGSDRNTKAREWKQKKMR